MLWASGDTKTVFATDKAPDCRTTDLATGESYVTGLARDGDSLFITDFGASGVYRMSIQGDHTIHPVASADGYARFWRPVAGGGWVYWITSTPYVRRDGEVAGRDRRHGSRLLGHRRPPPRHEQGQQGRKSPRGRSGQGTSRGCCGRTPRSPRRGSVPRRSLLRRGTEPRRGGGPVPRPVPASNGALPASSGSCRRLRASCVVWLAA
ncbi:uncharacterized protein SOCE26_102030 [Sorangium cellulosum]|uniref:Uncharacterized protein n=1 Tax=Sorangium cellulosum TaxID=56 RepID=A0A2L0FB07_SORCE|nr:uncharacterized protein SOCE26_102030 [Sorangium cellulosum]